MIITLETAKCDGRQAFTRHCSRTCILFFKGWCFFLYLPFPLQKEDLNQAGLQTSPLIHLLESLPFTFF